MATETQRHRVSKTPTVSAERNEMFQATHSSSAGMTLLPALITEAIIEPAEYSSLSLAFSVPLWPSLFVAAAGCARAQFESANKILVPS